MQPLQPFCVGFTQVVLMVASLLSFFVYVVSWICRCVLLLEATGLDFGVILDM